MDLGQREVPKGEADTVAEAPFDPLDGAEGLSRVRAHVVAVLEDQDSRRRAADVIDGFLERLDH